MCREEEEMYGLEGVYDPFVFTTPTLQSIVSVICLCMSDRERPHARRNMIMAKFDEYCLLMGH